MIHSRKLIKVLKQANQKIPDELYNNINTKSSSDKRKYD